MLNRTILVIALCAFAIACKQHSDLKPVMTEKAGEYSITILSASGALKKGPSDFTMEFRKTADNQLIDVGAVTVAPVMEMPGMGPMMGDMKVSPSGTPGRYDASGKLSMVGRWKLNVKFGEGQSAELDVTAE